MRNLLFGLMLLAAGVMPAVAQTFSDLLNGENTPGYTMTDQGVVTDRDIASRTIVVGGFMYLVGNGFETEVTLLNTSAGAYELLNEGMKVEVEYFDLEDDGRLAIRINQIDDNEEVEF
ncbi:MAG: hypothetical protein JJ934_16535 [Pseudomonadales bacterium]|nr:hypothetical protein [Pseudomonadales bacterium]MBO6596500.1 hypothetical protein [Pseudomonadales bacterium]MBO6658500.1 hypothetical protein [Pseudomonadales bacterium]MBO6822980.1 hypothetical protein [Pseudomonadales bacterium]